LTDTEDFAELRLSKIKSPNFPDSVSDGLEVKPRLNILLDYITYSSLLFSM